MADKPLSPDEIQGLVTALTPIQGIQPVNIPTQRDELPAINVPGNPDLNRPPVALPTLAPLPTRPTLAPLPVRPVQPQATAVQPLPPLAPFPGGRPIQVTTPPQMEEYTEEELTALTVTKLKDILRDRGYKVSGRKADLIARILNPQPADAKRGSPARRKAPAAVTVPKVTKVTKVTKDTEFVNNLRRNFLKDPKVGGGDDFVNFRYIYVRDNDYQDPLNYNSTIINRNGNSIMKMMEMSQKETAKAISDVYGTFRGTKDETLSLYWWGVIYPSISRYNNIRKPKEVTKINKLSLEELQSTVPNDWPYPRDRASITFRLVTGYNPPRADATVEPRYQSLLVTDPKIVSDLARYIYNYYGMKEYGTHEFYSHYTPYRHVSLQKPSILEPFVLKLTDDKYVRDFAIRMGMRIPPNVDNEKKYFLDNLRHYEKVLTRDPARVMPVPDLGGVRLNDVNRLLETYTDDELLDGYELKTRYTDTFTYTSREDLIDRIREDVTGTANKWQFRIKNCQNADRENLFTVDVREDDEDDPMISYGTAFNYRCWNQDELAGTWEEHDGMTTFNVPDWKDGDNYKTFPLPSIGQLLDLLIETRDPIFTDLIETIQNGLAAATDAQARVRKYRQDYLKLPAEHKQLVKEYLAWMFFTSMYMRFWKGPGNPYPAVWKEGGGGPDRCDNTQRGNFMKQQFKLRTRLLDRMPDTLEQWALSFPRIEYNFNEGTSSVGAETINYIIEEAQLGQWCLAEASDLLAQTSYYLLMKILETNLNGINEALREYTGPVQPDFNPFNVTGTRHVDPYHRLQLLDE